MKNYKNIIERNINDNSDINLIINDNEKYIINILMDNTKDTNINIIQNNNTSLILNYAGNIKNDTKVNINSLVKGNNNEVSIKLRVIGYANGIFNVNVKTLENTVNNIVCEDLKGINEDGNITFIPNLEVNTNEVEANHFAIVKGYDENELFYLESIGISREVSKEIIRNNFINNIFEKR